VNRYGDVTYWLMLHTLVSVAASLLLAWFVPRRFKVRRRIALLLIFGFVFFIPVLGLIGMLSILVYFRYFQHDRERTEFYTVTLPPFMNEAEGNVAGMGEGGAWSRLRARGLPRSVRLQALLAASSSKGHNSSRLLQMATSDNDDEIRLLAFNLYDQREKVIGASISDALHKLKSETDREELSHLYRTLGFAYWELVFNEINTDLSGFFLNHSLSYVQKAIELGGDDPSLMILAGRIHLRMGEIDLAQSYIYKGLENGAHRDRVIPYLAEIAYRRRDFKALKRYFVNDPLLRFKPGIGPVANFWTGR
jgi:polysaccharide biosynthesis protein PelE